MRLRTLLLVFSFLLLTAARQRAVPHPSTPQKPADVFTFSNTSEVMTKHLALDLTVDFSERRLRGSATLTLEHLRPTNRLVLDSENLNIESVQLDGATAVTPVLGLQTMHGRSLTIPITSSTRTVTIHYTTSPEASGLFWNTAAQSYGRQLPYLYSLSQPIGARSWIPIQDTPSMRLTYEATVRVPSGMLALMSAENPTSTNPGGIYTFRMPENIPPYLVALAVARLEFHPFDERTGVYAEPELLADAVRELSYLPEMLDTAEEILGPHPFPRHDLLLMPPTFVVGGMEHPRLNFLNPSVASGNHPPNPLPSLLIAHELAHSWAGDATTTGSWEDVWLNEGITSYLAIRIIEAMSGTYGPLRAEHQLYVDRAGFENFARTTVDQKATLLHRPLGFHENPESNFGSAAYTKGELFIQTLEDHLGEERFDALLRTYFQRFAWSWVDDRGFIAFLRSQGVDPAALSVEQWIYSPGVPSNISAPTNSAIAQKVRTEVIRFAGGTPFASLDRTNWTDIEIDLFLQVAPVSNRLAEIDQVLNLSSRNIPPLRWMLAGIFARYQPIYAGVERVLLRGGSNGAVLNLYNALINRGERTRAAAIFAVARERYHDSVRAQVEQMFAATSGALWSVAA